MNKGEIWLANLPIWTGREQLGIRPIIMIADTNAGLVIVIPLTSNLRTLKYSYTLKIETSKQNGLNNESAALILQIKSIDKIRLIHKIGHLENSYIEEIDRKLKSLLKL